MSSPEVTSPDRPIWPTDTEIKTVHTESLRVLRESAAAIEHSQELRAKANELKPKLHALLSAKI